MKDKLLFSLKMPTIAHIYIEQQEYLIQTLLLILGRRFAIQNVYQQMQV